MPAEGRFVDVRGTRTHLHEAGSGPAVVLIHGSGPGVTAWANWRFTVPALVEAGLHVFAYDVVGFGRTEEQPGIHYGIAQWVDQLIAIVEDEVGEKRTALVGNSMGGAIALGVAAKRPDLIERMVLMGSTGVHFELTQGLDLVWGYEPSMAAMRTLLTEYFAYDASFITEDLVRARYEASLAPGSQERYAALFPAPRQRWIESLAMPEGAVRKIETPTLLVHGRDDKVVPLETSLRLLSLLPRADLHVFARCGHWTQIERAAEFNALIARTLLSTP
jgi:pimeloyl-ACP methyl ester carboxylesterase